MEQKKESSEQTVTITRPEFNELVYGASAAAEELRRLRQANQSMAEKLFLVEGLLQLRHLQGPGFAECPDQGWNLEEIARHMEIKYQQASTWP